MALFFVRIDNQPPKRLLAAHELCFDMDFSPFIFRIAPDSPLAAFRDLLQIAGVPRAPSVDTLTRYSVLGECNDDC